MSAYTDVATIRAHTGLNNALTITNGYIQLWIDKACATIDGAIAKIYALPLPNTPPDFVVLMAIELTIGLLYLDQYGEETTNMDKGGQKRIDNVKADLKMIRDMEIQLIDPTTHMEIPRSNTMRMTFFPTPASSDPSAPDSTAPQLTMGQRF